MDKSVDYFVRGFYGNSAGGMRLPGSVGIFEVNEGKLAGNKIDERFAKYFRFQFMEAHTYSSKVIAEIGEENHALSEKLKNLDKPEKRDYSNFSESYCPVIKIQAWEYNQGISSFSKNHSTYVFDVRNKDLYAVSAYCQLDFHKMIIGPNYVPKKITADSYAIVFPWLCQQEVDEDIECAAAVAERDLRKWLKFWTSAPEKRPVAKGEKESLKRIILAPETILFDMTEQKILGPISKLLIKNK